MAVVIMHVHKFLCCCMYFLFCDVLCIVCVYVCTVLLPPGGYPIAVKYIISYIISYRIIYRIISYQYHIVSYHIISYHHISYHIVSYLIIYHIISSSSSCSGRIRFDSCSLYPLNEIGPSISSSVILCVFVLLVYIVVLV